MHVKYLAIALASGPLVVGSSTALSAAPQANAPKSSAGADPIARGAEVSGRLLEESGEPVAEAKVQLARWLGEGDDHAPKFDLYPGGFPHTKSAKTDKDGRFTITEVPPGKYLVLTSRRLAPIVTSQGKLLMWELGGEGTKRDVGDVTIRYK